MDVCLRVLIKESKKSSEVRQLQCQEQCIYHIPCYLLGLLRAHFFRQPFRGTNENIVQNHLNIALLNVF